MDRHCKENLVVWKSKENRKPLILLGARQVGKTYLLKEFGTQSFKNTVYLNFEANENLNKIFESDLDAVRIVRDLRLGGHRVVEGETILIFDEVQQCGRALTSLKYFCEQLPNLHVCAAGSLLGLFLAEASFPVGKVEFLPMYPLTFSEFLSAINATEILGHLDKFISGQERISKYHHALLFDFFKEYLVTGGLPEVVSNYAQQRENISEAFTSVRNLQSQLIINYIADMAKHSGKVNSMHIERLWHHSSMQLAKTEYEGAHKFKFKDVIPNIRGYERLASVIDWLVKAGLSLQIPICNQASQPLKAYTKDSIFKLYCFDVGILGAMTGLQPQTVLSYDFGTYKGYFAENFVLQELHSIGLSPLSWQEATAELEFLLEQGSQIIPIEVKSGNPTKSKSLKTYRNKYHPKISLKISGNHIESLQIQEGILNIPLYAAGWLREILRYC